MKLSEHEIARRQRVREKLSPNARIELDQKLLSAARQGFVQEVATHLAKGADPNARDSNGDTALMLVVMAPRTYRGTAYVLIEEGADLSLTNKQGLTAFALAILESKVLMLGVFEGKKSPLTMDVREAAEVVFQRGPVHRSERTWEWVREHILAL